MWFVYILSCSDNTFYTGITNDLKKRIKAHNNGTGAKYTRCRRPVYFVFCEKAENKSDALKREIAIKSLRRDEKLLLIKSDCNMLDTFYKAEN